MDKILTLSLGSISGGLARYFMAGFITQIADSTFPYGTLAVNVIGCFIIGFLSSLAEDKLLLVPQARLLLMTGFCGAFTTFSTFILETSNLMKDGEIVRALLNILISIVIGFLVFRCGMMLARIF